MNFSGGGVSWTLGPRGASVGVGKRGAFLNTSLVGSGFSSREQIGGASHSGQFNSSPRATAAPIPTTLVKSAVVKLMNDGSVVIADAEGRPLSAEREKLAKLQSADSVRSLLIRACEQNNADIEATLNIHYDTPPPATQLHYALAEFTEPTPLIPTTIKPKFLSYPLKTGAG